MGGAAAEAGLAVLHQGGCNIFLYIPGLQDRGITREGGQGVLGRLISLGEEMILVVKYDKKRGKGPPGGPLSFPLLLMEVDERV